MCALDYKTALKVEERMGSYLIHGCQVTMTSELSL